MQATRGGLARRAHADPRLESPRGRDAPTSPRRSRRRAARRTSPCWCRPRRSRAGRSGRSATTSPGCGPGPDGRLWAINPEAGFFGVAPGTSSKTNPNAMATPARELDLHQRRGHRRTAVRGGKGIDGEVPEHADRLARASRGRAAAARRRRIRTRASPRRRGSARRSRRTGKTRRACRSPRSSSAAAARASAPLVFEAFDWDARRLRRRRRSRRRPPPRRAARSASCGAIRWRCCPSAATTWPTTWRTGCGIGPTLKHPPQIFHVNWFRQDANGKFLWPGFGENMRVLRWVRDRCEGTRRGRRVADRAAARRRARSTPPGSTSRAETHARAADDRSRRLAAGGRRRWASSSPSSATACRPRWSGSARRC